MKQHVALKSLYSFVAVAELGSMTLAAERLFVSHSAVSQAVKSLERQLDTKLFHRVGRAVELTREGKAYYREVAPALEKIVRASEAMIRRKHDERLTINMVNSLALHWWIPRVEKLHQAIPNLDARISNLIGPFDLEREGVDVALVHGKVDEWNEYHCEKLGDDELVMVCSPTLAQQLPSSDLTALINQHPIIWVTNARRKHDWDVWSQALNVSVPNTHRSLTFNASIQAIHAAIRSLGLLVTHRLFIKDEVDNQLLVEVSQPVVNPHQEYYFACPPDRLKLESTLALRRWLKDEFAPSKQ
ncbi:LysR substrate-binding domain-containing protein [Vibrio sp. 10N]|uniref:LysR substrate-binding domain-containing protein n=1 Tax=Vibrio sp. 10N TaxID=3058938 RepID=UPI002812A089|nr:LysR substrate-binding domain-containing protein [Vibrio sp. 10N]